jgi:hypothetical protein
MVRMETLVDRLVKKTGNLPLSPDSLESEFNGDRSPYEELSAAETRQTIDAALRQSPDLSLGNSAPSSINSRSIENPEKKPSDLLLAAFPSQECVDMVVKMAGPMPSFFHQLVRRPYKDIQICEKEIRDRQAILTVRHTHSTHPLIIVQQMLLLAISFRYIHPSVHHELTCFPEPPRIIMQRVADAAIDFVNTNDRLLNTVEGLECLLLVASFQADSGGLRDCWLTTRQAMLVAQLMCLHHQKRPLMISIEPNNARELQYLWYRIVYYDRFFSLLLGLPQGSIDTSMGEGTNYEDDTAMGRLERRHCVLASQILRRNEQDPSSDNILDTQAADLELRKLAESMPSKWWLVPNLASIKDSGQLFWATIRLTNQVFHYLLLSHLHLPFVLYSSWGTGQHNYKYNRVACIQATRECLSRYMAFRTSSDVSYCCHSMDFFAITAAMTLILAHLDGQRSGRGPDNSLVQQRTSDRAIMEEILDNMEEVGTLNKFKTLSDKGAGMLRQLLAIEADASLGSRYCIDKGDKHQNDAYALRLSIPYFGLITITRDYKIPEEHHQSSHLEFGTEVDELGQSIERGSVLNNLASAREPVGNCTDVPSADQVLTVAEESWAFSGAEMTLFDTLMQESSIQTESNADYWWLL